MSGISGPQKHGPTGRGLPTAAAKRDLKSVWDAEAAARLFTSGYFHSEMSSLTGSAVFASLTGNNFRNSLPGSWGGSNGNTDLNIETGDGVSALNLYSTQGGGITGNVRPGSAPGGHQSWGIWPNTYAHFAFQVMYKWDPATVTGTRPWEALEHGLGDLYRDGWFVGLHGFHVAGGASGTAPAIGGPYISITCGWSHWSNPGRAIHSTVPIVNGRWHRVQFGRSGLTGKTYLKVDDESYVEEKTSAEFVAQGYTAGALYEAYPNTQTNREMYIHGKGGSGSSSNQSFPMNAWYRSLYHAVAA